MPGIPVYLDRIREAPATGNSQVRSKRSNSLIREGIEHYVPKGVAGRKVLIKPNLLKSGELLCVTPRETIIETARLMKDLGARVTVADSPAFGSAEKVLNFLGIDRQLKKLGVRFFSLKRPVKTRLPCGIALGISETALEADLIINLPRPKVHCQMGFTCAVKNCFGTVVGFRKALCHTLYGHDKGLFSAMILEICEMLPATISIVDATTIMHVTGPSGGEAYPLGIIAAGDSAIAVDTCIYTILNLEPKTIPLWKCAREQKLKGSRIQDISFTKKHPAHFKLQDEIIIPEKLAPITFNPLRLLKGRAKSVLNRLL